MRMRIGEYGIGAVERRFFSASPARTCTGPSLLGITQDDVIKRLAVRARKGIERRRFLLVKFCATPAGAQRHLIAALSGHIVVALL
jgi:hypothetical protein